MLFVPFVLNIVLMITLPLALVYVLARRFGLSWWLAGAGALTFVGSQVVHLPLLWGLDFLADRYLTLPRNWAPIFNAIVLGLLAGLSEELARYLAYARWLISARSGPQAIMFGAGHGGAEAIIVGAVAGLTFANMIVLRDMDLTTLPNLTPENIELLRQQIEAFWATPWHGVLLGSLERVFAITFHISAALLVLVAVVRRNPLWLVTAILWHTILNAVTLIVLHYWGGYWAEAALGGLTLVSAAMIVWLRRTGLDTGQALEPTGNGSLPGSPGKDNSPDVAA